jgi:thiol-disulfide isomerase/thioredoxin
VDEASIACNHNYPGCHYRHTQENLVEQTGKLEPLQHLPESIMVNNDYFRTMTVHDEKKRGVRKKFSTAINLLLFAFLLTLVLSGDAKSWMMRQLISVGIFNATLKTESTAPVIGQADIHFTYAGNDGKTTSTADLAGKVVFVNFWATWCPPCRAEMPSLNGLYKKFQHDTGYVFLFISEDEDFGKAVSYLNDKKLDMPAYRATSVLPAAVFSGTLPTTIVIDKTGKIVYRHEGMANYDNKKFIRTLTALR